jgi:aromatic-L-amino-acid/L-tryptophan decarboxylase
LPNRKTLEPGQEPHQEPAEDPDQEASQEAHQDFGHEPDLDPRDWERFSAEAHQALDLMIEHLRGARQRKVWQPAPAAIREKFKTTLPQTGRPFDQLLATFETAILPYANGNTHPLFLGWVHGAGTPVGMVAEMLAAGLDANCGGRDHIGIDVENQITLWLAEVFGFPADASGLFVTGSSMANMLATIVARTRQLGQSIRGDGLRVSPQLVGYTSHEAHACIARAFEMTGIGSAHLRRIAADAEGRIRVDLLARAIEEDRGAGLSPFLVVGTAGSVNIGAIDDLGALAALCREEDLWFHVDGAFGALCVLSPELKPLIKGIEEADSIALDFHKWLHVPYDAGFFLCRDGEVHRSAFMNPAAYLSRAPRGLAAGEIWPTDLGPDLSRSFRALKTWFTFQSFGAAQLGASIAQTCRIARHLADLVARSKTFELCAPVPLNIVCFSLRGDNAGPRNEAIVMDLHESGLAAPSTTHLDGRAVIRAAIVNHRTRAQDMETFLAAAEASAARLAAQPPG